MKNCELVGLQTASGEPILMPVVSIMCEAYRDYMNNYLLISTWASAYGVEGEEAQDDFYHACKSVYHAEHEKFIRGVS